MLLETESFTLALRTAGDESSSRLALVLPGRLDTKDYAHMRSHVEHLAARGFYAVSFDPPGSWESPGGLALLTTTNYLLAVEELIRHFDSRPTLLLGHSRGGAAAVLAATNPQVVGFACAMASYGAASAPSVEAQSRGYQLTRRDWPTGQAADNASSPTREFALPLAYFEDSFNYDSGAALRENAKPKLVIYGSEDEFTAPETVEALYASAPDPKLLRRLDCGHDYRFDTKLIAAVNGAVDDYLERFGLAG